MLSVWTKKVPDTMFQKNKKIPGFGGHKKAIRI